MAMEHWRGPPDRDLSDPHWQDPEWSSRADAMSERLRISTDMMAEGVAALIKSRELCLDNNFTCQMVYTAMANRKRPLIGGQYSDMAQIEVKP